MLNDCVWFVNTKYTKLRLESINVSIDFLYISYNIVT